MRHFAADRRKATSSTNSQPTPDTRRQVSQLCHLPVQQGREQAYPPGRRVEGSRTARQTGEYVQGTTPAASGHRAPGKGRAPPSPVTRRGRRLQEGGGPAPSRGRSAGRRLTSAGQRAACHGRLSALRYARPAPPASLRVRRCGAVDPSTGHRGARRREDCRA